MVNRQKQQLLLITLSALLSLVLIVSSQIATIIAAPQFSATTTPMQPMTLIVTKLEDTDDGSCDPDDCSLREAIVSAQDGSMIQFDETLNGTFELLSSLEINQTIVITNLALRADNITLKAMYSFPVFKVEHKGNLTLTRIALTANSNFIGGGGIFNDGGDVQLIECSLYGNDTSALNNIRGFISVERSLFYNNHATTGGAINNQLGEVVLTNSTFFANRATSGAAVTNKGTMLISYSTFAQNTAVVGDNVFNGGGLSISNSIIVSRGRGERLFTNCEGQPITDKGNNIQFPNNDCGITIPIYDPLIESLADHGGPTLTIALQAGSPAVDAGNDRLCEETIKLVDQRGFSRQQGKCDIGAYEKQ